MRWPHRDPPGCRLPVGPLTAGSGGGSLSRPSGQGQNRRLDPDRRDREGDARMEIRVLGPVEVLVDGHVRSLRGAGERELLALLALSARRVIAVPALVDALWGEALPVNPGNALQVRVSKL